MGSKHGFQDQIFSNFKKLFPYALVVILPFAIFRLCFSPVPVPVILSYSDDTIFINPLPANTKAEETGEAPLCDYTNGKWVPDKTGPMYNSTTCNTIKEGQNCISHGRPDMDYLFWKWKPNTCDLPRFDPTKFLNLMSHKNLAFVGDSMARNQLESLLCMLSTASNPTLVYRNGEDNKFRKWHFDSHNFTLSVYWSPFLVKGTEKSSGSDGLDHNILYLDSIDERWGADLVQMDMVVLSIGHWFLHKAVYYDNNRVLGCHSCDGMNHTEIGFYDVFRKAINTTLKTIVEERGLNTKQFNVVLSTFSPSHFEGRPWDSLDACNRTKPYNGDEKFVEGMDEVMRGIEVDEMEAAKRIANPGLRLETLDVTGLSILRPDGHPGPYMYPFPFAKGVQERVPNDCLHWCLPGPVDTWNEILLSGPVTKFWG